MTEHVPDRLDAGYRLNDGTTIPCLGLGVFQTEPGPVTQQAVRWAIEAGYRMIDTAAMYQNESDVGEGVRASGVPRKDVYVTTKLWYTDHGYEASQHAFYASLRRLGLEYVDLYLIHWPRAPSPAARLESWKGLEKIQQEGLCRSIGVSNYTVRHLQELLDHSQAVPAVDQVEFHPFVYDPGLVDFCDENQIRLEAWSPLTRGKMFGDPVVARTAAAHGRSPAQVLLRWGLQHHFVEIPKSTHRDRIVENSKLFDFALSAPEMEALDGLRGGARIGAGNPADIP
jgi:methylglyoxal/glyoxal reductase